MSLQKNLYHVVYLLKNLRILLGVEWYKYSLSSYVFDEQYKLFLSLCCILYTGGCTGNRVNAVENISSKIVT